MSLGCAVCEDVIRRRRRGIDSWDRFLMKRFNQEANEGGRRWQSRARVQEGTNKILCGDRHTKNGSAMHVNGSLAGWLQAM
jgi:hypothetical protein